MPKWADPLSTPERIRYSEYAERSDHFRTQSQKDDYTALKDIIRNNEIANGFDERVRVALEGLVDSKYWDLAKTLLWIGFRDLELVAKVDVFWRSLGLDQYLNPSPRLWMSGYLISESHAEGSVKDLDPASTLLKRLQSGTLKARGKNIVGSASREIESIEWHELNFCGGVFDGRVGGAGVAGADGRMIPSIHGLIFDRKMVIRSFPVTNINADVALPDNGQLKLMLLGLRGEDSRKMSQESAIAQLLEQYPNLKRDSLRALDREIWPNPGRGRKRKIRD